jgi:WD40 repeat protein
MRVWRSKTAGGDSVTELQDSGTGSSVPIAFDAFISYSRRDAGAVVGFVRAAERRDRSIWFDADDIPAGAPWREELATAIEVSDAVVCCLSRDWSGSAECQREYDRAVQLGKRLVPVVVATMRDPPAELAALQWIDARDGADPEHVATQVLAAIDADHERVREHTHWLWRALRWESGGSENSLLLRGKDLVAAEEWMSREAADPSPTALQRRFIVSSRQAERRRLRITVTAAMTAVVVSMSLALVALVQWRDAVRQRDQAQSRALAAAAMSQLDVDPERSLLLSRAAWEMARTSQALSAIRASVQQSRVRIRVTAHAGAVSAVSWADHGKVVVSAGRDGAIRTWDAATGARRGELRSEPAAVVKQISTDAVGEMGLIVTEKGIAWRWSADPRTGAVVMRHAVASGVEVGAVSTDGQSVILAMTDGRVAIGPLEGHRRFEPGTHRALFTAQLSGDGALALTASEVGSGSVTRVSNGKSILRFDRAYLAAMDPKGRYVATSDVDGRVFLYPLDGRALVQLQGSSSVMTDLRFSADGTQLLAAGLDGTARVWSVPGGVLLAQLRGPGSMERAVFSPDGRRLVTGHGDGSIRTWELPPRPLELSLETPAERRMDVLTGDSIEATGADFAPSGATVVTSSRDGLARIWDAITGRELPAGASCTVPPMGPGCLALKTYGAQGLWLTDAVFGPDGRRIATSAHNGSVVIWDARTAAIHVRVPDAGTMVDDVAFSPDGHLLATAARDGRARIIDAASGRVLAVLRGSDKAVYRVVFASNGRVLTAGEDGLVREWSVRGQLLRVIADLGDTVLGLDVNATGDLVAAAVGDKVVLFGRDGHHRTALAGHVGLVSTVEFDRRADLLISGGLDGTVRVWDVHTGDAAAVFDVPGGGVLALDVDGSGQRIVAATPGGAAYITGCEVCVPEAHLVRIADAQVTRKLTDAERVRFGVPAGR